MNLHQKRNLIIAAFLADTLDILTIDCSKLDMLNIDVSEEKDDVFTPHISTHVSAKITHYKAIRAQKILQLVYRLDVEKKAAKKRLDEIRTQRKENKRITKIIAEREVELVLMYKRKFLDMDAVFIEKF